MTLSYNPILATDSYKLSHSSVYPKNVVGMFSYIEARTSGKDIIIPFGLQMFLKKYFTIPVTMEHVEEATNFAAAHGEPFNREAWEHLVYNYDGFFPVIIRAVPEGTPVKSGNVLVTIECYDPKLYWLSSFLETVIQRAVWYPSTIASADYAVKKVIAHYYRQTGADESLIGFSLHDFGARGVTSSEQAEIGGAAHLVSFMGSDTIEGVRAANYYYNEPMAAFSVPATEHSIECAYGPNGEEEYLNEVLETFAKPGAIVSVVIDGYDVYRAAQTLCTKFKDKIISSGAKIVFRPDSGDMLEVVPRILAMQDEAFGHVVNAKGYKKINNVGIIQGDGVDRDIIDLMLYKLESLGYSADNMVFGSGGALLQKVNRDTYKFAQKASAILVDEGGVDIWKGISKSPITDSGKTSKAGVLDLVRSRLTGELITVNTLNTVSDEFYSVLEIVYGYGQVFANDNLSTIRERCKV